MMKMRRDWRTGLIGLVKALTRENIHNPKIDFRPVNDG